MDADDPGEIFFGQVLASGGRCRHGHARNKSLDRRRPSASIGGSIPQRRNFAMTVASKAMPKR
jgi:hypothetical protein